MLKPNVSICMKINWYFNDGLQSLYIYIYKFKVLWINCCHFKWLILHMSLFQILSTVLQTRVSWALSVWKALWGQFTPPDIWKQQTVLLVIYAESSNTKISECLGVTLRRMYRIWKELDEYNGDYKGTAAWKPHSNHSSKKRTQASPQIGFSQMRKISAWIKWWTHRTIGFLYPHKMYPNIYEKQRPSSHHDFRVVTSNDDIITPLIFPHGIRHNTEISVKCFEEVVLQWIDCRSLYIWQ